MKHSIFQGATEQRSKLRYFASMTVLISLFWANFSFAYNSTYEEVYSSQDQHQFFFTIDENSRHFAYKLEEPHKLLYSALTSSYQHFRQVYLLYWDQHLRPNQLPHEKYNRNGHFGQWINDPNYESCHNIRAQILIRDSQVPVRFKDRNKCVVESGRWHDPYTGATFTQAKDLHIDHFVPLKDAYTNGAWAWDSRKRCMFANFIENEFHLIPVEGRENLSKGDKAPDGYLPSNPQYVCQYVANWLKTKLIWNLTLLPPEAEAIRLALLGYNCDGRLFQMTELELATQRMAITQAYPQCQTR